MATARMLRWLVRCWAPLLAAVAVGVLCGCESSDALVLTDWNLRVASGAPATRVTLPAHLDDALGAHDARYVLERTVAVPRGWRGRPLTLAIPYLPANASLRANGALVREATSEIASGYRSHGPHVWRLPPEIAGAAEVQLSVDVDHTFEQSAWIEAAPRIVADSDGGDSLTRIVRLFTELVAPIAVGMMLAIASVSLILYWLDRSNDSYRFLGVATLAGAWYLLYQSGATQVVGRRLEVPLTGTAVVTAVLALVGMAHAQCKLPRPSRLLTALWCANAALDLASFDPFRATRIDGTVAVTLFLATLVYILRLYWRAARSPAPPLAALDNLVAFAVLAAGIVTDALWWTDIADPLHGVHTSPVGLVLFGTVQFFAIARVHANAQRTALARQSEIVTLNEELRRQLRERSQALAEAFARLARTTEHAQRLEPGAVVDDRYRVVGALGEGSMGATYEVRRESDGRALALKVLTSVVDARVVARFAREAYVAASLTHPCLVPIVDVSFSSSGFVYLVMELVDGGSLDAHRQHFGDASWAMPLLADVADGLAALHAAGVVHRDMKPGNVLVSKDPEGGERAKIADFGIASVFEGGGGAGPGSERDTRALRQRPSRRPPGTGGAAVLDLTEEGEVVGTPAYMAPELVCTSGPASPASDVFSLGMLAYEMLSGRRAFATSPATALLRGEEVPLAVPLRQVNAEVPVELAAVVDQALAVDPQLRPRASRISEIVAHHVRRRANGSGESAHRCDPGGRHR